MHATMEKKYDKNGKGRYFRCVDRNTKTTSMENFCTGVLGKNKEHYLRCKNKAEKSYGVFRHIQLHMSQYNKQEDFQSIMSNLQPNCCIKVDFQKVNKHTGGKLLIHDTKHSKDSQL